MAYAAASHGDLRKGVHSPFSSRLQAARVDSSANLSVSAFFTNFIELTHIYPHCNVQNVTKLPVFSRNKSHNNATMSRESRLYSLKRLLPSLHPLMDSSSKAEKWATVEYCQSKGPVT